MKKFFICFAGLFLSTPLFAYPALFAGFQQYGNPACEQAIKKRFSVAPKILGLSYSGGTYDCHPYTNNCSWYRVTVQKDSLYDVLDVYCKYNDKAEVVSIRIDR